jgi:lipoprotein-anchoring transpeptidase ErfK/SrfK
MQRSTGGVNFVRTMYSVHVDLSSRRMRLRNGTRTVRSASVAIGRPGSPTPTGRFAVTDKLNGRSIASYYGCCILALNAHQPNLPPGWSGGNRMAIHGTDSPGSIGSAASAGCVRARDDDLRTLMSLVPPGAPVFIRR